MRRGVLPIVLVAAGGFAGATSRYAFGAVSGEGFVSTILVNTAGCFILGVVLFGTIAGGHRRSRLRMALGTGFAASFTTYSTFVADIVALEPMLAGTYVIVSYAAGVGGILLARWAVTVYDDRGGAIA